MEEPKIQFCPECGNHLEPGAHFCGVCGHEVPGGAAAAGAAVATEPAPATASEPAPPPPPTATSPVAAEPSAAPGPGPGPEQASPRIVYGEPGAPPDHSHRTWFIAAAAVLVVLAIGIAAAIVFTRGDDETATTATSGDEVLLEAVGQPTQDAFTASVTTGKETTPSTTVPGSTTTTAAAGAGGMQIAGAKPGLYGGTQDAKTCDAEQLISFLQANPDKAAAWAGVLGITPAQIPTYVRSLTPVLLTKDTRVTNHGFKDGKATTIPAVLQAGTAVMVDRYGVPRVKCGCGNPLTEPAPVTASTRYVGMQWPRFSPATVVHVTQTVEVNVFVLVSIDGSGIFSRTPGADGTDTPMSVDELCDLYPDEPTCATTTTTAPPTTTTTAPPTSTTLPPAPSTVAPTVPPTQSGDRSNEAANWVMSAVNACDPTTEQYVTSVNAYQIDHELYQVEVRIVLDSGGWLAVFEVDFATEEFPDIRPADADSAALICM